MFSSNLEEHTRHVHLCYINFGAWPLCQGQEMRVRYVISPSWVVMDARKATIIQEWPTPTKLKEVQSFLGFTNFYQRFIDDLSTLVQPLTLLEKIFPLYGMMLHNMLSIRLSKPLCQLHYWLTSTQEDRCRWKLMPLTSPWEQSCHNPMMLVHYIQ